MASSPLAQLMRDRVGSRFRFADYEVSRAETPCEAQEAFELRHRVFVEEGFLDSDQYSDGLLRDRFDDFSTQILVRDRNQNLVATTRFVRYSEIGFPTEHLFNFDAPAVDRARLGEYGRLAIDADHRGGARAPMLAMLKAVFECMIEERTTHVFAFLSPKLAVSYAALGCLSVPLVTRRPSALILRNRQPMKNYFENQDVMPVLFDLHEMMIEVGVPSDRRELGFVCPSEEPKTHARAAVSSRSPRPILST